VREADQHVDRPIAQVPGLDDRNAEPPQALARALRLDEAGDDDAVGAAADHRLQQRFLAMVVVAALAEDELVAGVVERFGQRLQSRQELRDRDMRHERRDHPAALRLEAAGEQVRDVAGRLDRLLDACDRLRRDDAGIAERPRRGDGRDAGGARDVVQRGGFAADGGGWCRGHAFGPGRQWPTSGRGYCATG
jgi:hypothetical protein